jgi:integrase
MPRTRRLKGSGSVYASGDRWIVQKELGVIAGRRRYKRWVYHTLTEAQRKLRQIQDGGATAKSPTVATYLGTLLAENAGQWRPRTLGSLQTTVDLHVTPFIGHIALTDLTAQTVGEWLKTLRLKKRGTATVRYARVVLRTLLRHAQRAGWLTTNPAALAAAPKHRKAQIAPLTPEQATAVLLAVRGHWIEPIVLVALACGLRKGEILGLQWPDIDFTAGTLSVRRTLQRVPIPKAKQRQGQTTQLVAAETKTASSRRTITLPSLVTERLQAHREEMAPIRSRWVFCTLKGTPIEPGNVNRAWRPLRAQAGVPDLRIHDLRHSAATFALLLGIAPRAVADMLGHAETRTTLDLYTHVLPSLRDGIAGQIDTLLRTMQPQKPEQA